MRYDDGAGGKVVPSESYTAWHFLVHRDCGGILWDPSRITVAFKLTKTHKGGYPWHAHGAGLATEFEMDSFALPSGDGRRSPAKVTFCAIRTDRRHLSVLDSLRLFMVIAINVRSARAVMTLG